MQDPLLTDVDVARLLSCSIERVQERFSHVALQLPDGELRWKKESVLAELRPVPASAKKAKT